MMKSFIFSLVILCLAGVYADAQGVIFKSGTPQPLVNPILALEAKFLGSNPYLSWLAAQRPPLPIQFPATMPYIPPVTPPYTPSLPYGAGYGGYGYGGYGMSMSPYAPYANNYYSPMTGTGYSSPQMPLQSALQAPASSYAAGVSAQSNPNQGVIEIHVPTSAAIVWINGGKQESGLNEKRYYYTGTLNSGQDYEYKVRAQWVEHGENVTQERTVHVEAGQTRVVNFLTNDKEARPASQGATSPLRTGY